METASASNLTISMEVSQLCANSDGSDKTLEVNQISIDEIDEEASAHDDISYGDYLEFASLVEAEASTEDIEGKTLVANVVINRLASDIFPYTLHEVINDPGQFEPAENGYLKYVVPTHEAKLAVIKALDGNDKSRGALYFQKSAAEQWGDKTFLFRYGSHSFYK